MDGFTLTGISFPVAPTDLTGFTIEGFAFFGANTVTTAEPERVELTVRYAPRVSLTARNTARVELTARGTGA